MSLDSREMIVAVSIMRLNHGSFDQLRFLLAVNMTPAAQVTMTRF